MANPDLPHPRRRGHGQSGGTPSKNVFAATSFAIFQEDENGKVKIRRGEDWRRSSHNATIRAWDVPTHHMVGDFAAMARRMTDAGDRQWPVRHPSHNATFFRTKHGLTLWFHLAMCFGATASVWNFNRVADALQLLTRMLLLLVGGHYVDDFNGVEYAEHSDSAFNAFSEFFHVLDLRVKDSKAQPPASRHVIQGVEVQVRQDGVELCPTPRRVAKLRRHSPGVGVQLLDPTRSRTSCWQTFVPDSGGVRRSGTRGLATCVRQGSQHPNRRGPVPLDRAPLRPVRPGSHPGRRQAKVPSQLGPPKATGRDLRGRLRQDTKQATSRMTCRSLHTPETTMAGDTS